MLNVRSEGHDLVALRKEPRHVGGRHPAPVDLLKVVVVRPTGDGAALSDEHRNGMVSQLGEELTRWRHAHALDLIGVVAKQELSASPPRIIEVPRPTSTEPLAAR